MCNSGNQKNFRENLTNRIISVFLNLSIKHVQENEKEKKFDCKRKDHFLSQLIFNSIATLKNKDMVFYVNFVS